MNRIILFVLILINSSIASQELPVIPRFTNFTVEDFKAGNQNWSITQDKEGRMYFANNRGVLEFDHTKWKLYTIPTQRPTKSVFYSSDNRLYIGAFEEFGYFTRNKYDTLEYTSLKTLLKNYQFHNDEIWNIVEYDNRIFFQSFSSYFVFDGTNLEVYKDISPLNFMKFNGDIYSQIIGKGMHYYSNDTFDEIISRSKYDDDIISLLSFDNELTIAITCNKGLFRLNQSNNEIQEWNNEINEELKLTSINKAIMTKDSICIIGTISNGIYALNKYGRLLWKIDSKSNLINNTVLGLFCDRDNNIWVAFDNGISCIFHNSSISIFNPNSLDIGMVHDALINKEETYIATNQGLFYYRNNFERPILVEGTEGQAWSISKIDNQLICGHNSGSFEVKKGQIVNRISDIKGGRSIVKCTIHNQDIILQNTYTFFNVYKKDKKGKWVYSNKIKGFMNLIQHIEVDHSGNIWAEHKYKGIYKIKIDDKLEKAVDIKFYNKLNSQDDIKINVFKILGRVVFSGDGAFYTYDDLTDSIISYTQLNSELPGLKKCYKVIKQNDSKYWFIDNQNYSLVEYKEAEFRIIHQVPWSIFSSPPIENKGNVFFSEYGNIYFALNGFLAKCETNQRHKNNIPPRIYIKEIVFFNQDEDIILPQRTDVQGEAEYEFNNIRISLFTSFLKDKKYNVLYRLEGLDRDSVWHNDLKNLEKSYSRLPAGNYVFRAIFQDGDENISDINYSFTIKPPLYLSSVAIIGYVLLSMILISCLVFAILRRVNKKKNNEIEKQRQQIIELEKEQLESELKFKSKELSNFTMLSIKNKDFLSHIKKELQEQNLKTNASKKFNDSLIRNIDNYISSEDDWAIFQTNFDRIHENFFRILKSRYPELTSNDLRLCALLRLNLSSKDISNMMNISLRGIEGARYRLRKRLNIPTEQDLVDFLILLK